MKKILNIIFLITQCLSLIKIPLRVSLQPVKIIYQRKNRIKSYQVQNLFKFIKKEQDFYKLIYNHRQFYINKCIYILKSLAEKKLATYYGEIGVGKGLDGDIQKTQYFKMMFDTGSCEFWIPSFECQTERCKNHQTYKPSQTFSMSKPGGMEIQYLSGKVAGDMVFENIYLGDNLVVEKQIIGIAKEVQIPLLDNVNWDGIIGLAYANQNLKTQGIKTVFDNIIQQGVLSKRGEPNQFAYYLGSKEGQITFGGVDNSLKQNKQEQFLYSPVIEQNYWSINLYNIRKIPKGMNFQSENQNQERKMCPNGCKAIVDTGTYLIYGPASKIIRLLDGMKLDTCADKSKLPDIAFEFMGEIEGGIMKPFELILTPDDYVLKFEVDGEEDCVIGIVPDNVDTGYTIGQVFLKAYYTVFDRDRNRIGFVKSNQVLQQNSNNVYESMRFQQRRKRQLKKRIHK